MAPLIRLTRFRAIAKRDLPLDLPKGDADLLPIALLLWGCSALRVASTFAQRQNFDVEATLALLFLLALPLYAWCTRHARDNPRQ